MMLMEHNIICTYYTLYFLVELILILKIIVKPLNYIKIKIIHRKEINKCKINVIQI